MGLEGVHYHVNLDLLQVKLAGIVLASKSLVQVSSYNICTGYCSFIFVSLSVLLA